MKIKPCIRCQNVDVFGRYQYCPTCKEIVEAERKARQNKRNREKYKQKIGGEYKYNKNYGLEMPKPKPAPIRNAASERWKRMSWKEISAECARYHLTYGQIQQMYYSDMLPEDFGLHNETEKKYGKKDNVLSLSCERN